MGTYVAADTIPQIAFFTPDVQETFGNYLINVLYVAMPLLLIWMAVEYAGVVIRVIRDAFSRIMGREDDYDDEDTRD